MSFSACDFVDRVTSIMRSSLLTELQKLEQIDASIALICEANDGHDYNENRICVACGWVTPVPTAAQWRKAAWKAPNCFQIDDDAEIGEEGTAGEGRGAYVAAWVWVSTSDALGEKIDDMSAIHAA